MKTLLLAVVVVAFVCLDSGYTLVCRSCTGQPCILKQEQCQKGQNLCYEKMYEGDLLGMRTIRGCTDTCATPEENEKIMYCTSDRCN